MEQGARVPAGDVATAPAAEPEELRERERDEPEDDDEDQDDGGEEEDPEPADLGETLPVEGTFKLEPLQDRVLVRRFAEAKTFNMKGMTLHKADAWKEKPLLGRVIEVGEGKLLENGTVRPLRVRVDDIVLFHHYAGMELPQELGERLLMVREDELLAIVSPLAAAAAAEGLR
jgi:chaperonin GroES